MSAPDPYEARRAFFAPARGMATIGGIVAGLLIVEFVWAFGATLLQPWPPDETGTAFRTFAVHLLFLLLAAATFLVTRTLQGRNPVALLGRLDRAPRDFLRTARALLIFFAVLLAIPGNDWEGMSLALGPLAWLALLPVACLAVLIQTGAEEFLYRGYLQQSLGALHDHPAVWMVLPSALFGLAHYDPTIPWDATLAYMIWTAAFGLAAADLTARTGSLGAATGLHFAYNLPLVILFAPAGEMSGFSLFTLPTNWFDEPMTALGLGMDLIHLWMLWMVCRIAIRR